MASESQDCLVVAQFGEIPQGHLAVFLRCTPKTGMTY